AKIIGAEVRTNLEMSDGFFENNEAHQIKVIQQIRHHQPSIVFCNAPEDRHPDHGRASILVEEACFKAGLAKIKTHYQGMDQKPWRPTQVFHYIQSKSLTPHFVVDISDFMDQKMEAILAHSSQFYDPHSKEPNTFISGASFLDFIKGRAKEMGHQVGVEYAEGFITHKLLGIRNFDAIIQQTT
ncbi:MAG: bacillithiol biosynthesis deacetylase BshB1, partial [Chitinophagia bacterium]|nr:bacillithiol biosynthesis deacetylase BshB1 [Chitinophagia bacterium]